MFAGVLVPECTMFNVVCAHIVQHGERASTMHYSSFFRLGQSLMLKVTHCAYLSLASLMRLHVTAIMHACATT